MAQKTILFLSSYSPVLFLLALQLDWSSHAWLIVLLNLLGALGVAGLLAILGMTKSKPITKYLVRRRRDAGAESAAFLAGYLLPLLTASLDTFYALVATAVYLLMAWVVTVRSSLIQVNPVLLILGFRIVQVEYSSENEEDSKTSSGYFLVRRMVRVGDIVLTRRLGGDLFVAELA